MWLPNDSQEKASFLIPAICSAKLRLCWESSGMATVPPLCEVQGTVTAQQTEHLRTNSITLVKMRKRICRRFVSARRRGPLGWAGEMNVCPLMHPLQGLR